MDMEENLKALRLKEKILGIELKSIQEQICAVQAQIQAYEESSSLSATTANSVQEKTESIPECPAPGKESPNPVKAHILLKDILGNERQNPLLGKSSNLVNMVPISSTDKTTSSPAANGTGKDNSNPLSPVALGKSKMTVLGQKQVDEDLRPDYLRAASSANNYYAVYGGPHQGVYTEWSIVADHCKKDKVTCKKFKSEEQAKASILFYKKDAADPTNFLRPIRVKGVQRQTVSEGYTSKEPEVDQSIQFDDFKNVWEMARQASLEDGANEKFYTEDKPSKSLFTFTENADPNLVHTAYKAGLVRTIYPSANLQELKFFPKEMIKAIKNFRKKVLNAKDAAIYIKIHSSIPDWEQSVKVQPTYFCQIGISKAQKELPSSKTIIKSFPSIEEMAKIRVNGLITILDKLMEINEDSMVKINYYSSNCIIASRCQKKISTDDLRIVSIFEKGLINVQNQLGDHTKKQWCLALRYKVEGHFCPKCETASKGGDHSRGKDKVEDNTSPIMEDSYESLSTSSPGSPLTNAYDERNEEGSYARIPL